MISGGWHADQDQFWVHVDIPQNYIDSRLAKEEATRVKKELEVKKKAAEAALKEGLIQKEQPQSGAPDFNGESL